MKLNEDNYNRAYILRLWRERPPTIERPAVWRLSLTDARSGERRAFSDPEGLLAFLCERVREEEAHADEN